jgi:hypothetical protein
MGGNAADDTRLATRASRQNETGAEGEIVRRRERDMGRFLRGAVLAGLVG